MSEPNNYMNSLPDKTRNFLSVNLITHPTGLTLTHGRFFREGFDAERLSPQIGYINSGAWVTNGSFTYVDTVYEYELSILKHPLLDFGMCFLTTPFSYHPECMHPTQLIQYEFTQAGAIQRKTVWSSRCLIEAIFFLIDFLLCSCGSTAPTLSK